jgi:hypothetical protein
MNLVSSSSTPKLQGSICGTYDDSNQAIGRLNIVYPGRTRKQPYLRSVGLHHDQRRISLRFDESLLRLQMGVRVSASKFRLSAHRKRFRLEQILRNLILPRFLKSGLHITSGCQFADTSLDVRTMARLAYIFPLVQNKTWDSPPEATVDCARQRVGLYGEKGALSAPSCSRKAFTPGFRCVLS